MNKAKLTGVMLLAMVASFGAYAQDSSNALHPEFKSTITFSSGLQNLNGNTELKEIPGVSTSTNSDITFNLSGAFNRAGEWAVEKEDGIKYLSGIGYDVGLGIDMSALYEVASSSSSYSESSDTNHYSLIQPMIDWYEANMEKYGLPYNPCGTSDNSPWPTTEYGSGSGYQFIKGSTVERADDVDWTSQKFADAERLYNDVKYFIETAIDQLYFNEIGTGNINQIAYADYSENAKKLAQLKMQAKNEFYAVKSGKTSSKTLKDVVSTAYICVTNICGVADMRLDFAGQRLTVGNKIKSNIAGQEEKGAALAFSLRNGVVPGLTASLSAGIAGGVAQNPENYDTAKLDYNSGKTAELAVMAKASYSNYFEAIRSTVSSSVSFVASDLLLANQNMALDVTAGLQSLGFISYGVNAEGMLLNYRDRTNENASYKLAYAAQLDGNVSAFGATLSATGACKSAYFSHKTTTVTEDRFYGYSLSSDYYTANLQNAVMYSAELDFNPEYFILYDVVSVSVGTNGLFYGKEFIAYGATAKVNVGFADLFNVPVSIYAGADYYRNTKLAVWDDMENLPEQKVIDFTKITAGVTFKPVSQFELSLDYVSSPSLSRRHSERVSSLALNGKISF